MSKTHTKSGGKTSYKRGRKPYVIIETSWDGKTKTRKGSYYYSKTARKEMKALRMTPMYGAKLRLVYMKKPLESWQKPKHRKTR